MPKKAGTEKWKKKRRQEYLEMKQYRYYIFCEGQQTEPNYFLVVTERHNFNGKVKRYEHRRILPCIYR